MEHKKTDGMAPTMGTTCVCGEWCRSLQEWHDHLKLNDGLQVPVAVAPLVGVPGFAALGVMGILRR